MGNNKNYGYTGRLLFLNLSEGKISTTEPEDGFYRKYLGGYGIGAKIIFDRQKAGVDPLGEESIISFLPGLLNGTNTPFSGRYTVACKSPITGTWGDANSGGHFGPTLKKAGYDGVFVEGRSDEPVYLFINNDEVEIRSAKNLWGRDCFETEDLIREELNDTKVRVACIGKPGEKLALISSVMNDKGRAAARSGVGAAMGSKNLKAIAVKGDKKVAIADPDEFKKIRDGLLSILKQKPSFISKIMMPLVSPLMPWMLKRGMFMAPDIGTMVEMFGNMGTSGMASVSAQCGDSPIKNWSGIGYLDFPMQSKASKISDDSLDRYRVKKYACQACPLGCGAIMKLDGKRYSYEEDHRPEYENIAAFGMMNLMDDTEAFLKCNEICNRNGMDTISTGSSISFAIECYENGILTDEDTDGLKLTWGNADAIVALTEKIKDREGLGDILADGTKRASERIGKGSEKYAMQVGGQEIAMHDPRLNPSFGTTYLSDPTPGRHTAGGVGFLEWGLMGLPVSGLEIPKLERYAYTGKGEAQALVSNLAQITNCLGLCLFSGLLGPMPYVEIINAVTGWDFTLEELVITGERIQTLRQSFNVREGVTASKFSIPDRILGKPPLASGPTANITVDVKSMAKDYYKAMQWDWDSGRPKKERLLELGLEEIAEALY
ncbi:MAG: aldehyde ferredoxin oxidoreductase family protein [Halobacteriota archaeon]|nr:aldehyde ferredoxin oxidoreductase family protein [Halobacteriota archaeon]